MIMRLPFLLSGVFFSFCIYSQENEIPAQLYSYSVNLSEVANDKIQVNLSTPVVNKDEIAFIFPVSVPGYYNIKLRFGHLISNFEALDSNGKPLDVEKRTANKWLIKNASTLKTIKYYVDDVWEVRDSLSHWLPAENIFEENKFFLLNPGATMGYLEQMEKLPIQVQVKYPNHLYAATGADVEEKQKGLITYSATHYHDLVDKPIVFTPTAPLQFRVANADVLISVYAENGSISNQTIYKTLQPVLSNVAQYLDNTLPVSKYVFMGYFYKGPIFASAMLEHNNSSVFIYPEQWDDKLLGSSFRENLTNTSYHEFFHILTPLNVHSEELLSFNFANPSMSKHLWLYEGMTEYLSYHVQVNQKAMPPDTFFRYIERFIHEMKDYRKDVSLTEISLRTYGDLDDEFDNVELKGVLVNLLLDIQLRELSGGEYGVKNLMMNLVKKFGKDRSFKDEELFGVITSVTFPKIKEHFTKYVEGIEELPLKKYLAKVGLNYNVKKNQITINPNATMAQKRLREAWLYH